MRHALNLLVPLMLAGCAASIPPLPVYDAGGIHNTYDVRPAREMAARLGNDYAGRYNRLARTASLGNLPVIGAAMAGAVLTLVNPASAAQAIGLVGIGAAGYQVGRTSIAPAAMPMLYAQGVSALNCVQVEASLFLPNSPISPAPGSKTPLDRFTQARQELRNSITAAQAATGLTLNKDDPPTGFAAMDSTGQAKDEAQRELALAAALSTQAVIKRVLEEAKALHAATEADEGAGQIAGLAVRSVVDTVAMRVATKGLEGRSVDYKTLLGQFSGSPAKEAGGLQSGTPSVPAQNPALAKLTGNFQDVIDSLNQSMADVNRERQPYAAALERVKACPATLAGT